MPKVLVLVEGQTEESVIKNVLAPKLASKQIFLIPVIVTTRRTASGPNFKGGRVTYTKMKSEVQRLLGDTSAILVTTMLDFYGLPKDFPGWHDDELSQGDYSTRVTYLTEAFRDDVNHRRFEPYLCLHEFEALLFSDPKKIVQELRGTSDQYDKLKKIREQYDTPEAIDDDLPPSKRIMDLFPRYQKVVYGEIIIRQIDLLLIRQECPHFHAWLTMLENLPT